MKTVAGENSLKTDSNTKKTEWNSGPDNLCPADSFYSTRIDTPVKLRTCHDDLERFPPISIYGAFKRTVDAKPKHPALAYKTDANDAKYTFISYGEYWKLCNDAAKSFIKIGLGVGDVVCIIGFNSPQWFISMIGSIFAGGVGCGIYTTNSREACEYILDDSKSKIIVVENNQQLEKIVGCKQKNTFKKIIQYSGTPQNNHNGLVMSWNEFINFGTNIEDSLLKKRIETIAPNKCATLIYTSGTTGSPKGAMLSHDNVIYLACLIAVDKLFLKPYSTRIVSYLPLSHIAGQILDLHGAYCYGLTVYFAQPDAFKGGLVRTLKEVRPTLILGVPRVWEKIEEGIKLKTNELTGSKKRIFKWATSVAYKKVNADFNGESFNGIQYSMAKKLVIKKIHQELGLDKCKYFSSGGAPLRKETAQFFMSLGIPILESFGMSEVSGPHTVGTPRVNRCGSCGPVSDYNLTKIIDPDGDGCGEMVIYGRHVFMGYLNNKAKTDEAFDDKGWLKTGDIAKIEEGFVYITGRLKELIITAGGENIAPVPIENAIKIELPNLVSNCMLVGDKRKFLTVLLTLKCIIDLDTLLPLDDLTPDCIQYLTSIGSKSTKVSHIIDNKDTIVYKAIEQAIKKANEKSVSRAWKVQKFLLLPRDFTITNGELGPSLKMKRSYIAKMYESEIDKLYTDSSLVE